MTAIISDCSWRAHGDGKQQARSAGKRRSGEPRDVLVMPWLARAGPQAGTAVLMPLLDVVGAGRVWVAAAFLLGVIARDALGDEDAARRALQRGFDLAEPDQGPFPFLSHPPPGLLDRHAQHPTACAALISQTADLLARADRTAVWRWRGTGQARKLRAGAPPRGPDPR